MKLKYISDSNGITRGVYIPIGDWNALKSKYHEIEQEEDHPIPDWLADILMKRMEDYENVDEKRRIVSIVGVFHSSLNPQRWQSREQ